MNDQPKIKLASGNFYKAAGAWDDLQEAIINAKHMIYITGRNPVSNMASCEFSQQGLDNLGLLLKNKQRK